MFVVEDKIEDFEHLNPDRLLASLIIWYVVVVVVVVVGLFGVGGSVEVDCPSRFGLSDTGVIRC